MLLNCGVGRLLRVPLTARRSNQSILKEIVLGVHWLDWCWSWNSNTWATWCKELTHLQRPWHWARLRAGGEGDDRGWDGWIASPTQWTWVCVDFGSWWWTGRPGVLWFIGSQRVGHDWATELNWTERGGSPNLYCCSKINCNYFPCNSKYLILETVLWEMSHRGHETSQEMLRLPKQC